MMALTAVSLHFCHNGTWLAVIMVCLIGIVGASTFVVHGL
jgi:hypothetical protein